MYICINIYTNIHIQANTNIYIALSAGAVEYTDCFPAEV